MPELPEAETIVRSIRPLVCGRKIIQVAFGRVHASGSLSPAIGRVLAAKPETFRRRLTGATIERVFRYGKHIVFELRPPKPETRPRFLWVHLGMTGRLTCESVTEPQGRHTHLILILDEPGRSIHYADIRQFGRLSLSKGNAAALPQLGPDPLEISLEDFVARLRSRRAMLKSLLLNQQFLRGLGNIYADEVLYRAGIHPATRSGRLRRPRALRLFRVLRETLELAIASRGSSVSDYVDALGKPGSFQLSHQVYRRTGSPCYGCGSVIQKMLIASRSTHFCPRCQRPPRGVFTGPQFTRRQESVR